MVNREITEIVRDRLFKNKVILISGARQVGKTTLCRMLLSIIGKSYIYLNCDEPDIRTMLTNPTSTILKQIIGNNKFTVIDEGQRIENIGITAKLIVDNIAGTQLIITGSSSLDIANQLNEPLTGRKFEFNLFPFSFSELVNSHSLIEEKRLLETRMIYGSYPEIVNNPGEEQERLLELTSSYLFKDILSLANIRKPSILDRLTTALALQIGSEVSMTELSGIVGIDKNTIIKYIDLLEKSYIVFSLGSFSRNLRNELKKSRKIYFWDTGIRNAIIKNFSPLDLRTDKGCLWENYIISERLKYLNNRNKKYNSYFWRTVQKQEIDYIEEYNGQINAYEIKSGTKSRIKPSSAFLNAYPGSKFNIINPDNYFEYIS